MSRSYTKRRTRGRGSTRARTRNKKRGGTRHAAARILSTLRNSPTLRHSPLIFSATRAPFHHEVGEKIKQKTEDPIEMISAAESAFANADTSMKNKELHNRRRRQNDAEFHVHHGSIEFTPQRPQRILDTIERLPIMSKTPGIPTTLDSPPPPSMNDYKTRSLLNSPSFRLSIAPTVAGVESIRKLNFDDADADND